MIEPHRHMICHIADVTVGEHFYQACTGTFLLQCMWTAHVLPNLGELVTLAWNLEAAIFCSEVIPCWQDFARGSRNSKGGWVCAKCNYHIHPSVRDNCKAKIYMFEISDKCVWSFTCTFIFTIFLWCMFVDDFILTATKFFGQSRTRATFVNPISLLLVLRVLFQSCLFFFLVSSFQRFITHSLW